MKRVPRSLQEKTIREVWEWFDFQAQLLARERVRVLLESDSTAIPSDSRFFGMTRGEVETFFGMQRDDLDFLAMLGLLAAAEATIRLDFLDRVEERWKDPVSRRFRAICKTASTSGREQKIRLAEDILETWRDLVPEAQGPVGDFLGALKLRHWLAHGKYWMPKLGRIYTPADVYDIAYELIQVIGAYSA